jgi:N-hydroxyarylamine O-acetyltransferase
VIERQGKARYAFSLVPRELSDFAGRCHEFCTSPESVFRKRRMCTRATAAGCLILQDDRLVICHAASGDKRDVALPDPAAYDSALREHFGIVLR